MLTEPVHAADGDVEGPPGHELGHVLGAHDLYFQAGDARGWAPRVVALAVTVERDSRVAQRSVGVALGVAVRKGEAERFGRALRALEGGCARAVRESHLRGGGREGRREPIEYRRAIARSQRGRVGHDGHTPTEEAVQRDQAERLHRGRVRSREDHEVGVLRGVGLDRTGEVEQGVAGQAQAGREQIREVGEFGANTHTVE